METLIGFLVMALAVIGGILIGVLITSLFYGKNQKKTLRKFPPEDMLKQGYFDETRLWVNPAQNSLVTEIDNEFHRDFKSLNKDQKRRIGFLQQLWSRWSEEEATPGTDAAAAVGSGWQYESNLLPSTPPVLADLEKTISEKENAAVADRIELTSEPVADMAATIVAGTAAAAGAAAETQVVSTPEEMPGIEKTEEPVEPAGEPVIDHTEAPSAPEGVASEEQVVVSPIEQVPAETQLSVTDQVNLILQEKIRGSGLENERIAIHDDQAEGVIITIGDQVYHSVEEVPYPQVRQLIKDSVLHWKGHQPEE